MSVAAGLFPEQGRWRLAGDRLNAALTPNQGTRLGASLAGAGPTLSTWTRFLVGFARPPGRYEPRKSTGLSTNAHISTQIINRKRTLSWFELALCWTAER